jgi:hypothetical protein
MRPKSCLGGAPAVGDRTAGDACQKSAHRGRAARRAARRALSRDFPLSARCDRCGVGLRYVLSPIGDEVLCASCASGNATEDHHIAGRKIVPWTVRIDVNLHRVVSRYMAQLPRIIGRPIPDLPDDDTPLIRLVAQLLWSVVGMVALYQASKILEASRHPASKASTMPKACSQHGILSDSFYAMFRCMEQWPRIPDLPPDGTLPKFVVPVLWAVAGMIKVYQASNHSNRPGTNSKNARHVACVLPARHGCD